ncbi:MAG: tRNA epoxyqueuosine(34) reductase QueG [Thermodesulfobacteriota bacterium]
MQKEITNSIKLEGHNIGFDLIGIAPVGDYPESQFYKKWLNKGYDATMTYMSKNQERRKDVRNIMPEAKSVISCAVNYNTDYPYSISRKNSKRGWIARYAWGDDYHEVINDKLNKLKNFIEKNLGDKSSSRVYVDTGPVLERMYGKYSGIGWVGKNTCLINQEIGSWLFLGEIITSLELEYDNQVSDRCGTCTKCIDECPTDAIREPYVLDSSRCISYLTIENKGEIPEKYRKDIGNNVFGCDICQDVCPWNNNAHTRADDSFLPREGLYQPDLRYLLDLEQEEFSKIFKNSPVKRAKRKGIIRNVLIAIGNTESSEYVDLVNRYLIDSDPLIRRHAVWALWKIQGRECLKELKSMFSKETDEDVNSELKKILDNVNLVDNTC